MPPMCAMGKAIVPTSRGWVPTPRWAAKPLAALSKVASEWRTAFGLPVVPDVKYTQRGSAGEWGASCPVLVAGDVWSLRTKSAGTVTVGIPGAALVSRRLINQQDVGARDLDCRTHLAAPIEVQHRGLHNGHAGQRQHHHRRVDV